MWSNSSFVTHDRNSPPTCRSEASRGEKLWPKPADRTIPCANCHGPDLKGVGPVPGIAGRSPSYIVRQLYDFQQGVRAGSASDLMKPTVAKLAQEDMISLAAYIASLEP